MDMRIDRVVLETAHYVIVGDVRLPREGYRSRFSDFLNRGEINFVPLTDAELYPRDGSEPEGRGFVAVSTNHVQLAYHYDEFEDMIDPYAREQATVNSSSSGTNGSASDDPRSELPSGSTIDPMPAPLEREAMNLEADDIYPPVPAPAPPEPQFQGNSQPVSPGASMPGARLPLSVGDAETHAPQASNPSPHPAHPAPSAPAAGQPGINGHTPMEVDLGENRDGPLMSSSTAMPELQQPPMGLPSAPEVESAPEIDLYPADDDFQQTLEIDKVETEPATSEAPAAAPQPEPEDQAEPREAAPSPYRSANSDFSAAEASPASDEGAPETESAHEAADQPKVAPEPIANSIPTAPQAPEAPPVAETAEVDAVAEASSAPEEGAGEANEADAQAEAADADAADEPSAPKRRPILRRRRRR